jgi:glycosyltransferase involved in cell wall biosynthesis
VKVLVVHPGVDWSVADVHNGLVKGLRACGCEVSELNLSDRLEFYGRARIKGDNGRYRQAFNEEAAISMATLGIEAALYRQWPDVVILVSGFFVAPYLWGVLARRPHHVVYWCTESPYEDDRQGRGARYADTVILNDPTNLDKFRAEINERTFYLPHSYDPDIHHPPTEPIDDPHDFAFVGTGFPSRVEWLERVDWSGVDAALAGNWNLLEDDSPLLPLLLHNRSYCLDNDLTADLYRRSKVSLNLYRQEHSEGANADGWAMGPREVELAACGTFFFRDARGEGDELFPHLPTITTPEAFSAELRWWLDHDAERVAAAETARSAVADRTFHNSARRLLKFVESAGVKIAA